MKENHRNRPPMLLPFVLQIVGTALAFSVLDGGYFAACYILGSGIFWIWAFRNFLRSDVQVSSAVALIFRWGPLMLFLIMFLCAEPVYRLLHRK